MEKMGEKMVSGEAPSKIHGQKMVKKWSPEKPDHLFTFFWHFFGHFSRKWKPQRARRPQAAAHFGGRPKAALLFSSKNGRKILKKYWKSGRAFPATIFWVFFDYFLSMSSGRRFSGDHFLSIFLVCLLGRLKTTFLVFWEFSGPRGQKKHKFVLQTRCQDEGCYS